MARRRDLRHLKPLARTYRHILYVPGNHESYKSSPTEVARNLAKLAKALPDHDRCDELLGKTRVVANPLGYPNEVESLEAFEPAFQVTV